MPKSSRRTFLQGIAGSWALSTLPVAAHDSLLSSLVYRASQVNEHEGRPCGAVEVYASGSRSVVQRQLLSLSATDPRGLTISPDGRFLVVAAYGGGIYNVLPIQPDGTLGGVSGIFKELGSGSHPVYQTSAHPHSVIFDPTGRFLLSSDLGCDRLSVFTLDPSGKLTRYSYVQLKSGSGPGAMELNAELLSVQHQLTNTCRPYRFNPATGIISAADSLGD
ncbi:MAG TPA: beta-propeller fold lactonase family protein [Bryobacteraceae bacterium]|nr:beta-propeller fold lactonase family protein [Bryobacteraceae bacterium]